jgi:flagellar FliL protein
MAEPEGNRKNKDPELELPKAQGPLARMLPWLIPALAVVLFAAAGFLVGRSFGTRGQAQNVSGAESNSSAEAALLMQPDLKAETGENWYYDLDPVVVNLNDPGVTRYVRVSLTLQISSAMEEKEGRPFLDQKKPLMKHWLTLFLSNQTIEDARGEKNLMRMQSQISDTLNNGLFPGSKPRIKNVLFKEFAIQ